MHWDYAVILALLGIIVPLLGRRRVQMLLRSPDTKKADRLRLYFSTVISQWALAALILWRAFVHGMTASDLGLAMPKPVLTVFVSAAFSALIIGNQLLSIRMMTERREEARGIMAQLALRIFPQDRSERLIFSFVVVTVAFCEEFIYRGFLQQFFTQLSGGMVAVGVLVASALFSIAHLYQGKRGLITTYVVGVLFSTVRAWTGTQVPGMLAHFAADLCAGFMLPGRIKAIREDASSEES